MDIKLKNNRKNRNLIAVAALLLLTFLTMCFAPGMNRNANKKIEEWNETGEPNQGVDTGLLQTFYKGCYVLYLETVQQTSGQPAAEIYLKINQKSEDSDVSDEEIQQLVNAKLESWAQDFEIYRSVVDYCIFTEDGSYEKNTSQALENAVQNPKDTEKQKALKDYYNDYFVISFNQNGIFDIEPLYGNHTNLDALIKAFQQIDREKLLRDDLEGSMDLEGVDYEVKSPVNVQIAFGIPRSAAERVSLGGYFNNNENIYWRMFSAYSEAGAPVLYALGLILAAILAFVMTSSKIWKTEISMNRPGNWYLMEAAAIGILVAIALSDSFVQMFWLYCPYQSISSFINGITKEGAIPVIMNLLTAIVTIFFCYLICYGSVRFIRPVFTLGIREYIRQYSFLYQIFPWLKSKWNRFKHEVGHIDFSEKSTKVIVKIVIVNFAVLTVCSSMWFFGIGALIVYSIFLFCFIKKYYDKAGRDYKVLLRGVNKIAEGDLESEITEDLGVFEPFKSELSKIRSGFKLAVDEEVKSQRMKTELITNVSHDLKTPLTAITTYVELLKNENITEEERRSYIETLEKKSLRLKVLIEDLFEVSKASSNNITLNLVEVDVVNLLKQVSIEHTDAFETAELDLRFSVPEEKIVLTLDSQKTYRIFENLFVNAQKYAMRGSRVYVDVKKENDMVEIAMKNMSAAELNFNAEEITERFVRGDVSRNTEGSGLGLAIARSFTEAQGGKLHVEVDGDLFKVVIQWKCGNI